MTHMHTLLTSLFTPSAATMPHSYLTCSHPPSSPAVPAYMHSGPAPKVPAHDYNDRDFHQDTSDPHMYPTRVRPRGGLELNARGVRPSEVSVPHSHAPKVREMMRTECFLFVNPFICASARVQLALHTNNPHSHSNITND